MRTDIEIKISLVDITIDPKGDSASRNLSVSQMQGMLNTWITQGVLVKVDTQPLTDNLILFKVIKRKYFRLVFSLYLSNNVTNKTQCYERLFKLFQVDVDDITCILVYGNIQYCIR